jgi:16S rRNA (uracil1498-N3)-methyltransferase
MPNYRLLVREAIQAHQTITLSKEHSQHMCKVLRLKEDELLSVFNPDLGEFSARLVEANPKAAVIQIQNQTHLAPKKPDCHLHLAQVISRGDRMDYSIQKATELGVHEITPIISERCGVQLSKERQANRMEHWQGVIESAVQQCGRIDLPLLHKPMILEDWLNEKKEGLYLAALVSSKENPIKNVQQTPSRITVLIGPEGGFSLQEEHMMKEKDLLAWQIGPRVLRTETATVVALTLLQHYFGDY